MLKIGWYSQPKLAFPVPFQFHSSPSGNDHEEEQANDDGHHDAHHDDGQVRGACEDQDAQENAAQGDAESDQRGVQDHLVDLKKEVPVPRDSPRRSWGLHNSNIFLG